MADRLYKPWTIVNGLMNMRIGELAKRSGLSRDTIRYYERQVLKGPTAFLEVAQGFEDYERAMTLKLLKEVQPAAMSFIENEPDRRTASVAPRAHGVRH